MRGLRGDGAGKGGVIKAMTEKSQPARFPRRCHGRPDGTREVANVCSAILAAFSFRGEVVIFDRSWYNRAGVERVMGFCTEDQAKRFLNIVPPLEKTMVDSGIVLLKYWLEVTPEEQTNRLTARIDDKRKIWKLTQMDLDSYTRWMITREHVTICSRRLTPRGHHGLSLDPTTRGRRDSISSPTCSRVFVTRRCPEGMSSCRNATLLAASRFALL
jgi:hypothetical protein